MGEVIRQLGCKIRAADHELEQLIQQRDKYNNQFYSRLRRTRSRNWATVWDGEATPESRHQNLERVPLPKFDGKQESSADFRNSFKVILTACNLAIKMVGLRSALTESAANSILGVTDPSEAWC